MPRSIKIPLSSGVTLLLLFAGQVGGAQEVRSTNPAAPTSRTFADTKDLVVAPGVKAEPVEYRRRKAVRLTKEAVD